MQRLPTNSMRDGNNGKLTIVRIRQLQWLTLRLPVCQNMGGSGGPTTKMEHNVPTNVQAGYLCLSGYVRKPGRCYKAQ
eukprot:SAG31_NODE_565_length_14056_cov_22.573189_11_plen_78_part_00